jgi:hypothetical protein
MAGVLDQRALIRLFYPTTTRQDQRPEGRREGPAGPPRGRRHRRHHTNEAADPSGAPITPEKAQTIVASNMREIEVIAQLDDALILNTLAEDDTTSHEQALLKIYSRLRRAIRPTSTRRATCSTSASSTRRATASAASAASASTASTSRRSRKRR